MFVIVCGKLKEIIFLTALIQQKLTSMESFVKFCVPSILRKYVNVQYVDD
jgi:hypothetical protein